MLPHAAECIRLEALETWGLKGSSFGLLDRISPTFRLEWTQEKATKKRNQGTERCAFNTNLLTPEKMKPDNLKLLVNC